MQSAKRKTQNNPSSSPATAEHYGAGNVKSKMTPQNAGYRSFAFFDLRFTFKEGFTLLEMVTSMGIFLVLVVSAIGVTIDIMAAQVRAAETQAIQDNIRFSLELITKELRTGFNYQNSLLGQNCVDPTFNQIQELTFTNSEGTQITCYWDSRPEKLVIMRMNDSLNHSNCGDQAYTQPLTSEEVKVKNLRFVLHGAAQGSSDGQPIVTIVLAVESADPRLQSPISMSLQTSIVQRLRDF